MSRRKTDKVLTEDLLKNDELSETEATDEIAESVADSNKATINSKVGAISAVVNLMAGMSKEETINLFKATMATIGHAADSIPDDAAQNNKASIAMKGAVKEEIEQLFGDEQLTEDFKEKLSTIFESALSSRLSLEIETMREDFEERVAQEVAEQIIELENKVDGYLTHVAESWMEQNEVAIESALISEINEQLIEDIREVFLKHNISVPENKIDVVEEMSARIDELSEKLNESMNANIELVNELREFAKSETFDEIAEGLTVVQAEKLRNLSEGIEYSDPETYANKLNILKEKFFNVKKNTNTTSDLILEESEINDETDDSRFVSRVPENMRQYVQAISNTVKN